MKHVAVFLADGFEEIEALSVVDYLRRGGIVVEIIGLTSQPVIGAHGITVIPDVAIQSATKDFDAIVLPGGMPGAENLRNSSETRSIAEKTIASGGIVAAICATPAIALASWGMLNHKKFTCYPGMENNVSADTKAQYTGERVTIDGTIVTGAGPGASEEFALALCKLLIGNDSTKEIQKGALCR